MQGIDLALARGYPSIDNFKSAGFPVSGLLIDANAVVLCDAPDNSVATGVSAVVRPRRSGCYR